MHSVTSNAVYNAIGMADWTRLNTLDSNSYIEGAIIANRKILHIHLQAYKANSNVTIGETLAVVTNSTYKPTEIKRASGCVDMPNGRYPLGIDLNPTGELKLYPMIAGQYNGSIGTIRGLYGDYFYVVN